MDHHARHPTAWVYVAGSGRSGSTLLGVLASKATHAFNCGELGKLWRRYGAGLPCECGVALPDCGVWSEVASRVRRALGTGFADATAVYDRRGRSRWARRLPRYSALDHALRQATERAVENVTGASAIVDTSKTPLFVPLAAHRPRPLVIVHLVRDPRGVAYSTLRAKDLPDAGVSLPGFPPSRTSRQWTLDNCQTEYAMWRAGRRPWVSTLRMTYEALAADPHRALRPVVDLIDGRGREPSSVTGHGVVGNTVLYNEAPVAVDRRWQTGMSPRDRAVTVALTAPLLRRYGYPLRPGAEQAWAR